MSRKNPKKFQFKANFQNGGQKKNQRIIPKKFLTGDNPHKRCLAIPHPTAKQGSGPPPTTRDTDPQKEKKNVRINSLKPREKSPQNRGKKMSELFTVSTKIHITVQCVCAAVRLKQCPWELKKNIITYVSNLFSNGQRVEKPKIICRNKL